LPSSVLPAQAVRPSSKPWPKTLVLYDGRQIFFGRSDDAKAYFEELGFYCPEQQTTADFLTSMTRPKERIVKPGWVDPTPRTADDFAAAWQGSQRRARLLQGIERYQMEFPILNNEGADEALQQFLGIRELYQSSGAGKRSPCLLSYFDQLRLLLWRSLALLKKDPSLILYLILNIDNNKSNIYI
jgi:hypothetical protein